MKKLGSSPSRIHLYYKVPEEGFFKLVFETTNKNYATLNLVHRPRLKAPFKNYLRGQFFKRGLCKYFMP
jgi:hypothetical protein